MKKTYLAILVSLAILSVNCMSYGSEPATKKDAGYISLNASKTIEVEPNLARVTFSVENTAETAQKASEENNAVSSKIIKALNAITNAKTDVIRTTNYSVRPVYATNKDGKRIIKNYTAVNSISVQTENIKNISNIIDAAIANGANRTEGLYFSYDNENSACNEMYPKLMESLKNQATSIAQAAGSTLDGIKSISASCSTESTISNGRFLAKSAVADSSSGGTESTPVEAGKVKVRVYVNVDFYVK